MKIICLFCLSFFFAIVAGNAFSADSSELSFKVHFSDASGKYPRYKMTSSVTQGSISGNIQKKLNRLANGIPVTFTGHTIPNYWVGEPPVFSAYINIFDRENGRRLCYILLTASTAILISDCIGNGFMLTQHVITKQEIDLKIYKG